MPVSGASSCPPAGAGVFFAGSNSSMICGMMTLGGETGLGGGVLGAGTKLSAGASGSGSGSALSVFCGSGASAEAGISPLPSTSSKITVTGAGVVWREPTFERGRTISGATPCRTRGRNPASSVSSVISGVSGTASFSCWRMLSWIRLLTQSSRSGFLFSVGSWEKIRLSGCREPSDSPVRNKIVMAGSSAGVFPPCTERMVFSGIIRGSNRGFRLSMKKIRSVVSMTSYRTESVLTRFVVRIITSPLFRYGLPMLSPVLYHFCPLT